MIRTMLLAAALAFTTAAAAPEPPRVELWRIDCGDFGPASSWSTAATSSAMIAG